MFIHENVLEDLELKTINENGKRYYVTPTGEKYPSVTTVLSNYKKDCLSKGMLDAADIVGALIFLLSDESKYISGQNIIVDDGWSL